MRREADKRGGGTKGGREERKEAAQGANTEKGAREQTAPAASAAAKWRRYCPCPLLTCTRTHAQQVDPRTKAASWAANCCPTFLKAMKKGDCSQGLMYL